MDALAFADRLRATGLHPAASDLAALETLVRDLDRAAAVVRGERPYAEEPLTAFRLAPP